MRMAPLPPVLWSSHDLNIFPDSLEPRSGCVTVRFGPGSQKRAFDHLDGDEISLFLHFHQPRTYPIARAFCNVITTSVEDSAFPAQAGIQDELPDSRAL